MFNLYLQVEDDEDKVGEMINKFWSEFHEFQTKEGAFEHREYIFKSHEDLTNSRSFLWHKKESLVYTKIFGKFACRVCSKILGIGSAERSWGDVKFLKDNKRSHLSGDRVKKQATIFGASCIELAKYKNSEKLKDVTSKPLKTWSSDDFGAFRTKGFVRKVEAKPRRIFKAYFEDWEKAAIVKEDVVNRSRLLTKYGGLTWMDADHDNAILYSCSKKLDWTPVSKKDGGGYCVRAISEAYDENDPDKEKHVEPWCINETLIEEISHYYKLNPDKGVLVVEEKNETDNDSDTEDDDDDDILQYTSQHKKNKK